MFLVSGGIVFIANLSRILRMACSPISEDLAAIVITTVQVMFAVSSETLIIYGSYLFIFDKWL